ncbi:MAG TPA: hypothetical protein VK436_05480 [Methanocella sp.]|nr:hypothetical protein [Methanocella sp.]
MRGLAVLTSEEIKKLVRLKAMDKDAFNRVLDEMRQGRPVDLLLSYRKFKEYAPNV